MPNITVANGGNGNLISGQAFTFYSSRTGNITLNLALSDFNATNHTIKITANWTWKGPWNDWAWDYNATSDYIRLYTTGTSSSSGTSKTYYLYHGGNKYSYGSITNASTYFSWAAAKSSTSYQDINTGASKTLTNATTVDLGKDNSLSMSIATSLQCTSSGITYGPIQGTQQLGAFTLTINPQAATMWVNDNGTWKRGSVWVNDNGTWKPGTGAFVNNNGTWVKGS